MTEKDAIAEKANEQGRLMLGGIALAGTVMIGFGVAELALNGIAAAETVLGFSFVLLGSTALAANKINSRSLEK
jgi:hypothetical protein